MTTANIKKVHRLVLIEPSAIIAAGIQDLLKTNRQFEFAAVIADYCHSIERIRKLRPDAVIINPSVVDFNHRHCMEELYHEGKEIPLIALVYRYTEPETLRHYKAVIDITDDRETIIRKLSQIVKTSNVPVSPGEGNELTEREKEILISVAKGMINKEIADRHHISIHTVITHRKNITRKTGIKSVAGLTVFAILNNLIEINEIG